MGNGSRLQRLDNGILGLLDNGGIYSKYSVHSMRALTYSEHGEDSKTDDKSIRPASLDNGLTGRGSTYRSIEEEIATKIFDAYADRLQIQYNGRLTIRTRRQN
jgi:hypothetical protein